MLSDPFDTKAGRVVVGLLAEGWTPARIAATTPPSCARSSPLAAPAGAAPGQPADHPGQLGAARPSGRHRRQADHLAAMLVTMAALNRQIAGLEAEMAPLLARTQGAKLAQIRGVATVAAAGFVAFVGHTGRWAEWSKVWRAAGLDPARSQSGATDASFGISREGSAGGRRAILDLAASICRQPGRWQDSYRARTITGHKHPKVALAATGNQIGRTCFALMASGADYDPDHETKRAERRTAKHQKAGGQGGLAPGTLVASEGRSDAVPAMRLDLDVSLAPALGPSSRPRMWRVAARPRMPTHQRAGVSEDPEATTAATLTLTRQPPSRRPTQACPNRRLD